MGQSLGSVGNSHKQKGAGDQKTNQPSTHPGQRMSDQEKPVPKKGGRKAAPTMDRARRAETRREPERPKPDQRPNSTK